ncbi:proline dehydrogenase [Paecilomyces lecythidis]
MTLKPMRIRYKVIQHQIRCNSTIGAPLSKASVPTLRPPLAVLPTGTLLRSLLVSAISSNRHLLLPSLSILSYLSDPRRGALLSVDRNPVLHAILKKTFYEQFCAGENATETKKSMEKLKQLGIRGIILTYARETVFDHKTNKAQPQGHILDEKNIDGNYCPNIEAWRKGTLETIDLISEGDYLALKLSGAGPVAIEAFNAGELPSQQMMDALDEICIRSRNRKVQILVDAESQHFQRGIARVTLELMRKYNREGHALVYNTYQAYLKSTPKLIEEHLEAASKEGFTLGLKLVRGAYIASDERALIHDTKLDTDNAYNNIAQGALKQHIGNFGGADGRPFPSVNLFLASHNKESLFAAYELYRQRLNSNLPTVPVRFGQLHGMSDEVSFSLIQLKDVYNDNVGPER